MELSRYLSSDRRSASLASRPWYFSSPLLLSSLELSDTKVYAPELS